MPGSRSTTPAPVGDLPVFDSTSDIFKDPVVKGMVENWWERRSKPDERTKFIEAIQNVGLSQLALDNKVKYQTQIDIAHQRSKAMSPSKRPRAPPPAQSLPLTVAPKLHGNIRGASATAQRALDRRDRTTVNDDVRIATYDAMLGFPQRKKSQSARASQSTKQAPIMARGGRRAQPSTRASTAIGSSRERSTGPFGDKALIQRNKLVESRRRLTGVGSKRIDVDIAEDMHLPAALEEERMRAERSVHFEELHKSPLEKEKSAVPEHHGKKEHLHHEKDSHVESAYFVEEDEYSEQLRRALGMEGCVTTHQSEFGLAEVNPHLFNEVARTGRGVPEPNQNFTSEWYQQFRAKDQAVTDKDRMMTTKRQFDYELHGSPTKQVEGGGESLFFKRFRQGKQYVGDLFSDSAKKKLDDYLRTNETTGKDVDKANERRDLLQALRNLHVTVQSNTKQTTYDRDYASTGSLAMHMRQEEAHDAKVFKDLIEGRVYDKKRQAKMIAKGKAKREAEKKALQEMLNKEPKKPATYEEYQAMFDRDGDGKDDFDLDGDGKRDVMIDEDDDGIDDFDPTFVIDPDNPPPIVAIPTWDDPKKAVIQNNRDRLYASNVPLTMPTGKGKRESTYQSVHGGNFHTICDELRKAAIEREELKNDVGADAVYLNTPNFGQVNMQLPDAPTRHAGYPVPRHYVYKKTKVRKTQTTNRRDMGATEPKVMQRHTKAAREALETSKRLREKSNVPLGKGGLQSNPSAFATANNEYGYFPGKKNVLRVI